MVSQKILDTMKWWFDTGRRDATFFEGLVAAEKITQDEVDFILGGT